MKTATINNSNNEVTTMNFISEFQGGYHAHVNGQVVPCHNLATARAQSVGTKEHAIVNCMRNPIHNRPTVACMGFVSPTNQFYAVVSFQSDMGNGSSSCYDVRIDCHNESTLRSLMRDGVAYTTVAHALANPDNVRMQGGWAR